MLGTWRFQKLKVSCCKVVMLPHPMTQLASQLPAPPNITYSCDQWPLSTSYTLARYRSLQRRGLAMGLSLGNMSRQAQGNVGSRRLTGLITSEEDMMGIFPATGWRKTVGAACGSDLNESPDCASIVVREGRVSQGMAVRHALVLWGRASATRELFIKSQEGDPAPDQQRVITNKKARPSIHSTLIIS